MNYSSAYMFTHRAMVGFFYCKSSLMIIAASTMLAQCVLYMVCSRTRLQGTIDRSHSDRLYSVHSVHNSCTSYIRVGLLSTKAAALCCDRDREKERDIEAAGRQGGREAR